MLVLLLLLVVVISSRRKGSLTSTTQYLDTYVDVLKIISGKGKCTNILKKNAEKTMASCNKFQLAESKKITSS